MDQSENLKPSQFVQHLILIADLALTWIRYITPGEKLPGQNWKLKNFQLKNFAPPKPPHNQPISQNQKRIRPHSIKEKKSFRKQISFQMLLSNSTNKILKCIFSIFFSILPDISNFCICIKRPLKIFLKKTFKIFLSQFSGYYFWIFITQTTDHLTGYDEKYLFFQRIQSFTGTKKKILLINF